jgi:hypothetical protein
VRLIILIIQAALLLMFSVTANAAGSEKLKKKNFEKYGETRGVLVLNVNWGRQWNCAGFENAQLRRLQFERLPEQNVDREADISILLKSGSSLLAKDSYKPYVLLVEPGEYALSGFDVKVALSVSDVRHLTGGKEELFDGSEPTGGSFKVAAGEIVYIGHFSPDCEKEPVPWRYYIEGREAFDSYVEGFREEYPYTSDVPVLYRLFSTDRFGSEYALEN